MNDIYINDCFHTVMWKRILFYIPNKAFVCNYVPHSKLYLLLIIINYEWS